MAITKAKKITYLLLLLSVSLVPFGQLWGFLLQQIFSISFRAHFLDIFLVSIFVLNLPYLIRKIDIKLKYATFTLFFSYLWGVYLFGFKLVPLLYLLRFVSVINIYQIAEFLNIKKVLDSIVFVSIFSSLIGWGQYLIIPDMRGLYYFGWDDHYFRMVGGFFDPAFLGIILVIGILTAVYLKKSIHLQLFLILSLAFTYSRASYLALLIGIILLKKIKAIYLIIFLLILLPILPRPGGYGVKLTRTHSVVSKLQNYNYSVNLISSSPLLGYGFNNICSAKQSLNLSNGNACNGLDNSFMFMLATLGVPASLILIDFYLSIYLRTIKKYKMLLLSLFAAIFVHSLFTNTYFYIPVVFIFMLIASVIKENKSREE